MDVSIEDLEALKELNETGTEVPHIVSSPKEVLLEIGSVGYIMSLDICDILTLT